MLARYAWLIAGLLLAAATPLGAEEARKSPDLAQNSANAAGTSAAPATSMAPTPTPPTVERVLDAAPAPVAVAPAAPAEITPPGAAALTPPATASVQSPATVPAPASPAPAGATVPAVATTTATTPVPATVSAPAHGALASQPTETIPTATVPTGTVPAADPAVAARAVVAKAIGEMLNAPSMAIAGSADKGDRDAALAFYAAREHAPLWTSDGVTLSPRGELALLAIRAADDWGLTGSALTPPTTPVATTPEAMARVELELTFATLGYARQARGGRIPDPVRQLSRNLDRKPQLLEPATVLAALAVSADPRGYLEGLHPRHPQFERLRQKWLAARAGHAVAATEEVTPREPSTKGKKRKDAAKSAGAKNRLGPAALADKLFVNMEQWRWMPDDLGTFYVWSNIPEYTVRVMRHDKVVHTEKIIIGKPITQTPVFSNAMNQVVFHPFWGVPDSIKRNEILPSLAKGGSVLARHNLRLSYKGRPVDASSIDWSSTDIRNLHVYQPPGAGNVLGVVKFLFPNHHQVYMHDTPTKNLFASSAPMYSHGCMRVRDPLKLAEVLLAEDKGWTRARVDAAVASKRQDQQITLDTKFPVHVTYFTALVDDDGKLRTMADVYGHERRIALGIAGRFREIPPTPASTPAQPIGRLVEAKQTSGTPDWARAAFGQH